MIGGVALVSGLDFGSSNAFTLKPGTGTNVLRHVRAYAWGKHAVALVEGAPQHEAIIEDVDCVQGAFWTVNGGMTTFVSYAGTPYLHAKHTYRNVRSLRNVGRVGSTQGDINLLMPFFISHNNNASLNDEQQFDEILFENPVAPLQTISDGYSIKRGGMLVRGGQFGTGSSLAATFEDVEFDVSFPTVFADFTSTQSEFEANDLHVNIKRSILKPRLPLGGFNRNAGRVNLESCVADIREMPAALYISGVFERHANSNVNLDLTLKDFAFISKPGGGISGQNSMLIVQLREYDKVKLSGNRYHINPAHALLTRLLFVNGQAREQQLTFADWQALGFDVGSYIAGTEQLPAGVLTLDVERTLENQSLNFMRGTNFTLVRQITSLGDPIIRAYLTIKQDISMQPDNLAVIRKEITESSVPSAGYIKDGTTLFFNFSPSDTLNAYANARSQANTRSQYDISVVTKSGRIAVVERGSIGAKKRAWAR